LVITVLPDFQILGCFSSQFSAGVLGCPAEKSVAPFGRLRAGVPATAKLLKWANFRTKALIAPQKNRKNANNFYPFCSKNLAQNPLHEKPFFSHEMRIPVQLWQR